jgi:hypothetical protein
MNFNSHNLFSEDDNSFQLNSFCHEFNDINSFSFMQDYKDIFEPSYDANLYKNNYDKMIPITEFNKPESKKTNIESNESINFTKEDKEATLIDEPEYKKKAESIQRKIREDLHSKMPFLMGKKYNYGRNIKKKEGLGKHGKFADDNITRKIKNFVGNYLLNFINKKISSIYSNDNSKSLQGKRLSKLKQNQVEWSKADYNKLFLNKNLQSIFSEDISNKYKIKNPKHNKKLIEELLNEKDEKKRLVFQGIFNLTFLDCLKHFRGSIFLEELSGMKTFKDYLNKSDFGDNSTEYKEILIIYTNNFEKIVMEKTSRKKKNKI